MASVAMNASLDAFFIPAVYSAEEAGHKKAVKCELITKVILTVNELGVIDI